VKQLQVVDEQSKSENFLIEKRNVAVYTGEWGIMLKFKLSL